LKRLKIGLDIDGVIVDYMQTMLPLLVEACNRKVAYHELCHWDLAKALNIPEYTMNAVWSEIFTGSRLLDAPPVEGAISGIKALNGHELCIVTGRPYMIKDVTEAWFTRHAVKYDELIFARPGNKLSVAHGFDVFIEDYYDEAIKLSEAGIFTLLFDRPWNQSEVLPASCRRVYDWNTIVSQVKQLEERRN
jgi:uncharacterized HAD superfamily protein